MLRSIVLALSLVFLLTGCMKEQEEKCEYNECGFQAPAAEIQAVQDYLAANNLTATQHCSGLFYRVENLGTGTRPNACSYVQVNYKGMLTNGNVFDQSGAGGAGFYLSQLIRGWANGVPQIKAGGRIVMYIPPSLGYGSQDVKNPQTNQVVIPANSVLIFEVDLLGVQ
jgi:FKBP-type peptidyl-prolyl cis-trans isomerase FkpA